jgi:hypothetical protein
MVKANFKKIAAITATVSLLLAVVLIVHIYLVTRQPVNQRVMVRLDFKQEMKQNDATMVSNWLYAQKGVDHVFCNTDTRIAVFTYSTAVNNANEIVASFKKQTGYKAERFMPDEQAMMAGCPVTVSSWTGKMTSLFN